MAYVSYNGYALDGAAYARHSHGEGYCILCGTHHLGDAASADDIVRIERLSPSAHFRGDPVSIIAGFQYDENDTLFDLIVNYLNDGQELETVFQVLKLIDHTLTTCEWSVLIVTKQGIRTVMYNPDHDQSPRVLTNALSTTAYIYSGVGVDITDPEIGDLVRHRLVVREDPFEDSPYRNKSRLSLPIQDALIV